VGKDLIDVLDEAGNKTGQTIGFDQGHIEGVLHAASHIWIYSPSGKILLQKRSMKVPNFPGAWDVSVAGHVDAGETPVDAAVREAREELGLDVNAKKLEYIANLKMETPYIKGKVQHREFWSIYFLELPEDTKLMMNPEEVDEFKWLDYETFLDFSRTMRLGMYEGYLELIHSELSKKIGESK
jgi:isopentenyldiphosphate isomerase